MKLIEMPSCKMQRVGSQAIEQQVAIRSQLERWCQILRHWHQKSEPCQTLNRSERIMSPRVMTQPWMRSKYTSTLPPARNVMIEICCVDGVNMRRSFFCCQDSVAANVFSAQQGGWWRRRGHLWSLQQWMLFFFFTERANKQWMMTTVHAFSSTDLFYFFIII